MKVLVIGGTGWVGHTIVNTFNDAGYDVTICSRGNLSKYNDEIPENITFVKGSKSSDEDMQKILSEKYDYIIDSVPSPAGVDNIVKFARGLKQYIHCSSTGGYAPLKFIPGDETMPYDNFMGGWQQKCDVDAHALNYHLKNGFPATVIRPSYITGPGLLPIDNFGGRREDFISDILAGNSIILPDKGTALLQPIHVVSLAASFLLAAEEPKSIGQIYNICLAKAVTITNYVEITAEALGVKANIEYMPTEEMLENFMEQIGNEVWLRFFATHMCYDISKAQDQLGYVPHITTEDAIAENAFWAAGRL
ncbi:MAG: NAD-dependent epimerase/dehydratase family protein [Planctomycetota bacterium]